MLSSSAQSRPWPCLSNAAVQPIIADIRASFSIYLAETLVCGQRVNLLRLDHCQL